MANAVRIAKLLALASVVALGFFSPVAFAQVDPQNEKALVEWATGGFFEKDGALNTVRSNLTAADLEQKQLDLKNIVSFRSGILNGGPVDFVKAGNLPEFAVRAEQSQQVKAVRRDILSKVINAIALGAGKGPMNISDTAAVQTVIKSQALGDLQVVDALQDIREGLTAADQPIPERQSNTRKTLRQRAAAFIAFLNEAVIQSTRRAGQDFVSESRRSQGFREFGLSFVLRGELQIGVGKSNVMRTISRGLDIGYDFKSRELVLRTVRRHEHMDGGTAMALGPKIELRAYRANLEAQEHLNSIGHVHGKTWYPPAPPLLTFATESFPGYHSVGTAFALNVFDAVVPTYLFNTVNEFDADYRVRRISLSPTTYLKASVRKVGRWMRSLVANTSVRSSAGQCRAIFISN